LLYTIKTITCIYPENFIRIGKETQKLFKKQMCATLFTNLIDPMYLLCTGCKNHLLIAHNNWTDLHSSESDDVDGVWELNDEAGNGDGIVTGDRMGESMITCVT